MLVLGLMVALRTWYAALGFRDRSHIHPFFFMPTVCTFKTTGHFKSIASISSIVNVHQPFPLLSWLSRFR